MLADFFSGLWRGVLVHVLRLEGLAGLLLLRLRYESQRAGRLRRRLLLLLVRGVRLKWVV